MTMDSNLLTRCSLRSRPLVSLQRPARVYGGAAAAMVHVDRTVRPSVLCP